MLKIDAPPEVADATRTPLTRISVWLVLVPRTERLAIEPMPPLVLTETPGYDWSRLGRSGAADCLICSSSMTVTEEVERINELSRLSGVLM